MLGRWSGPSWKRCSFSWTDFSIIELAFIHRECTFGLHQNEKEKRLLQLTKRIAQIDLQR